MAVVSPEGYMYLAWLNVNTSKRERAVSMSFFSCVKWRKTFS